MKGELNLNIKVINNSLWMMLEKVISIFGLIFVTSFVAKYIGPGIYGEIAYATTLFQIVQVVAQLGSDVIIFKRISKNPLSGLRLIKATNILRFYVFLLVGIPILFIFYEKEYGTSYLYIVAVFLSCLFATLDVYAIYNDAKLDSKKNTYINIIGLIISLSLRWFIAYLQTDPLYLCIPIVLTSFVPYLIRLYYAKSYGKIIFFSKRHKRSYVRYVLLCGSNLVVSSLSIAIYPRLAMLILGSVGGSYAVGVFSVAATLAGSWAFVCNSFITSTLPSIFSEKNDEKAIMKAAKLNIIVIGFCVPVLLFVLSFGEWSINILYGPKFSDSFWPLVILTFSTITSLLGTISARFIAKFSGYSYLSRKMLIVTLFSLILNIIFIRYWGVIGASLATFITEIMSLTILNYFFNKRIVMKLHCTTVNIKKTLFGN